MPDHKFKHKLHRKDLRGPDAFQTSIERLADRIAPHVKKIGFALIGLLIVGVITWTVQLQKNNEGEALNGKLAEAMQAYEENFQLAIGGDNIDWALVQKQFEDLIAPTAGTDLQPIVLQYIANTYIEKGEYDAALGPLSDLEAVAGDDPQVLVTLLYSRAKALELKGDQKGAAAAYNQAGNVVPNAFGEFLEAESKRNSGPRLSKAMVDKYLVKTESESE